MEYWYRYRDDLWKCVTIPDRKAQSFHERKDDADSKMACNIRRAARMIEGYALCNEWDWFGTFTLNPVYRERSDLDGFRADFMRFLRNERRRAGGTISALLVPELHRDKKGWHMHGLLRGIPFDDLRPFTLSERLPRYLRSQVKIGAPVYDWPRYRDRFGFVDVEPVRTRDAAARYITKYITKGWDGTAQGIEVGKHLYYPTRGLIQPQRIETENAPGCVPEAFPSDLVAGNSYPIQYNGVECGTVQWFERPSTK